MFPYTFKPTAKRRVVWPMLLMFSVFAGFITHQKAKLCFFSSMQSQLRRTPNFFDRGVNGSLAGSYAQPLSSAELGNTFHAQKRPQNWTHQVQFMVLGAQKAGTTSLFMYMQQHPLITTGPKEKKCFKAEWDDNDPFCEKKFPANKLLSNSSLITGDFTPGYLLYTEDVIGRVKSFYPWVKLIVILRNPIDRSFSQHKMEKRNNKTKVSYETRVLREIAALFRAGLLPHWLVLPRKGYAIENMTVDHWLDVKVDESVLLDFHGSHDELKAWKRLTNGNIRTKGAKANSLVKGLYIIQLRRWMSFFPTSRFLVLKNEDMAEIDGPQIMADKVFAHLNVDPYMLQNTTRYNRAHNHTVSIMPKVKLLLQKLFRPYDSQLRLLLGDEWIDPW